MRLWLPVMLLLAGCASSPPQPPQIQRISAEELERILPKPVPNLALQDIVRLSREGETADAIIARIKQSNSHYALTPSQFIDLGRQGVDAKVLDYIQSAHEQALRDSFADEINRRERESQEKQDALKRQLRAYPYYDPFWPYPYWRHPYYPHPYFW